MRPISAFDRIVIINDASTARGGATGLAILSVKLLRARGVSVTYICGDDSSRDELLAVGVEVVSTSQQQLVKEAKLTAFQRGIFNSSAMKMIASWIQQNDTPRTVYHVHGWSKILSPSIFSALSRVASRTVIHAHDFFLVCPNGAFMDYQRGEPCHRVPLGASCLMTNCDKRSYPQKLWRAARSIVVRSGLGGKKRWGGFITIHPDMKAFLVKGGLPQDRIVTVRNPAEPLSMTRIEVECNAKMLFIGRVEAEKGIEEAISTARATSVPLKVIGDGPLRTRLANEFPEVEFLGWRSREDISKLVHDARFLVMPSRYPEPFGLVAAESSQSGLPVLLSQSAFLSSEVVSENIGISCDTSDGAQFANAVIRLRDMPKDEIRAMSERAFAKTAGLSMSPQDWISTLLGIYGDGLGGEPSDESELMSSRVDYGAAR